MEKILKDKPTKREKKIKAITPANEIRYTFGKDVPRHTGNNFSSEILNTQQN